MSHLASQLRVWGRRRVLMRSLKNLLLVTFVTWSSAGSAGGYFDQCLIQLAVAAEREGGCFTEVAREARALIRFAPIAGPTPLGQGVPALTLRKMYGGVAERYARCARQSGDRSLQARIDQCTTYANRIVACENYKV